MILLEEKNTYAKTSTKNVSKYSGNS